MQGRRLPRKEEFVINQRNSGVKVLTIKCTQDQITRRRCLVVCLDFGKEELH